MGNKKVSIIVHDDLLSRVAAQVLSDYLSGKLQNYKNIRDVTIRQPIKFVSAVDYMQFDEDTIEVYFIGFPPNQKRVSSITMRTDKVFWLYPYAEQYTDDDFLVYGMDSEPKNILMLVSKLCKCNIYLKINNHNNLLTSSFGFYTKDFENHTMMYNNSKDRETGEELGASKYFNDFIYGAFKETGNLGKVAIWFTPAGITDFYKCQAKDILYMIYKGKKFGVINYPLDIYSARGVCDSNTNALIQVKMNNKGNSLAIISAENPKTAELVCEFLSSKGFTNKKVTGNTGYMTLSFSWENILTYSEGTDINK